LLDGNIGIGGDPLLLLRRLRELLSTDGQAVVEVEPPGTPVVRDAVRLRAPNGDGPWFDWAWVGADAIGALAQLAGFASCAVVRHAHRYVAHLHPGAAR
jgi:hypothetical protein